MTDTPADAARDFMQRWLYERKKEQVHSDWDYGLDAYLPEPEDFEDAANTFLAELHAAGLEIVQRGDGVRVERLIELIDELEDRHSRLSTTVHVLNFPQDHPETERFRTYYFEAKQKLIDAIRSAIAAGADPA